MRKLTLVCAALLCLSGAVAAQNDSPAPAASEPIISGSPAPAGGALGAPGRMSGVGSPWQVSGGFSYQRFNIGGNNSNLYGFQSSVARYIGDSMFGIEGATSVTFGYLNPTNRMNFLFYGGGLRAAKRSGTVQPWAHFLFGGSYLRTNQGVGPSSFNGFGLEAGAGVDIKFHSHFAWRVEGDYLGTRINSVWQPNVNIGAGLVVNF